MKLYYVYSLICSDGTYYTGVTNNIDRRVEEHNDENSNISYTSKRRPVRLVFCEEFNDINQAIELEKQIKGWSRRKKKALIEENWDKLIEYSKNYTEFGNMIRVKMPPSTSSG